MPSPRDITGDLARLHKRPLAGRPATPRPAKPRTPRSGRRAPLPGLRTMAFDPVLWLAVGLLTAVLACQFILMLGSVLGWW